MLNRLGVAHECDGRTDRQLDKEIEPLLANSDPRQKNLLISYLVPDRDRNHRKWYHSGVFNV